MSYSVVHLSALPLGPIRGRRVYVASKSKNIGFALALHLVFLVFFLAGSSRVFLPNSQSQATRLKVNLVSQSTALSSARSADTQVGVESDSKTRSSEPILANNSASKDVMDTQPSEPTGSKSSQQLGSESSMSMLSNPADHPAGVFGGSKRRAFSFGGGVEASVSSAQQKMMQEAERNMQAFNHARQQMTIFLSQISIISSSEIKGNVCRLDRDVSCDIEEPQIRDRLQSFWKDFRDRYSFVESIEIRKSHQTWFLSGIKTSL